MGRGIGDMGQAGFYVRILLPLAVLPVGCPLAGQTVKPAPMAASAGRTAEVAQENARSEAPGSLTTGSLSAGAPATEMQSSQGVPLVDDAAPSAPAAVSPLEEAAGDDDAPTLPMLDAVLPDAPGFTLPPPPAPMLPCPVQGEAKPVEGSVSGTGGTVAGGPVGMPCVAINPFRRFLDTTTAVPLTPGQKAYLAFHNFKDPANLITITGISAFTVGINAHTAYGPGWAGWGRDAGYSFSQDATGEFFGTFLIPSLFHEDPHYHRLPHAPMEKRLLHALAHTVLAQHDDGSTMPNYATLLTYPISAEISNLYVPGVHGNGRATVARFMTGLATDPVNNLITEFLPDVAKRINIRAIFVQRIINMVTAGASTGGAGVAE